MRKKFNNVLINYRVVRNSSKDNYVLLLHGFGGSTDSFKGLENYLISQNYSVVNLDFPGFGKSENPQENFTIYDYFEVVKQLLDFENINKVSVVAHSFGGRVAIILASQLNIVNKLILVDSAGIKPKFSLLKWWKIKIYKFKKFCNNKLHFNFDLSKYGSEDYKNTQDNLKQVFSRIVNTDLTYLIKDINCKTLLIWGKKDKSTPIYMLKKLNKNIKNSKAIVYLDCGHFSYIENHSKFCEDVGEFLSE